MVDVKKAILNWAHYEECDEEQWEYCDKYIGSEIATYEKISGKYVKGYSIFKDEYTNKYYQLEVVRTNVGYWGDADTISADCYEVIPKEITTTIYEVVK